MWLGGTQVIADRKGLYFIMLAIWQLKMGQLVRLPGGYRSWGSPALCGERSLGVLCVLRRCSSPGEISYLGRGEGLCACLARPCCMCSGLGLTLGPALAGCCWAFVSPSSVCSAQTELASLHPRSICDCVHSFVVVKLTLPLMAHVLRIRKNIFLFWFL